MSRPLTCSSCASRECRVSWISSRARCLTGICPSKKESRSCRPPCIASTSSLCILTCSTSMMVPVSWAVRLGEAAFRNSAVTNCSRSVRLAQSTCKRCTRAVHSACKCCASSGGSQSRRWARPVTLCKCSESPLHSPSKRSARSSAARSQAPSEYKAPRSSPVGFFISSGVVDRFPVPGLTVTDLPCTFPGFFFGSHIQPQQCVVAAAH
mmetsp:Transcript_84585/g.149733  ORF Transcript_84585/g.149733 Transcript_84585/m.149733 type:complete len:209 (-) Transcript_84585:219-845(-)